MVKNYTKKLAINSPHGWLWVRQIDASLPGKRKILVGKNKSSALYAKDIQFVRQYFPKLEFKLLEELPLCTEHKTHILAGQ